MRQWLRRLGLAGAVLTGVTLLSALGSYAGLRTEPGNTWLMEQLDRHLDSYLGEGADLQLGGLRTDLYSQVHLWDVRLVDADGEVLLTVDRAAVQLQLTSVLGATIVVPQVHLSGVAYRDRIDDNNVVGILVALGLDGPSDPNAPLFSAIGVDLALPQVHLRDASVHLEGSDGSVLVDADGLTLHGGASIVGDRLALGPLVGAGRLTAPVQAHTALGGRTVLTGNRLTETELWLATGGSQVTVRGTLPLAGTDVGDATVSVQRLRLDDVEAIVGDNGLQGAVLGELSLTGPLSDLQLRGVLRGDAPDSGTASVEVGADVTGDLSWNTRIALDALRPAGWLPAAGDTDLTGVLTAEGIGTSWPEGVSASVDFEGRAERIAGMEVLEQLNLQARLEGGVVTLTGLDADSPLSRVNGSGTLDLNTGLLDVALGGPVYLAELARVGVPGLTGRGTYQAQVRGELYQSPPKLLVGGDVDTTAGYDGSVSTRARGPFQLQVEPERLVFDSELTLTNTDVAGALTVDRVRTPIHADIALDGSLITVEGHAVVEGLHDATDQLDGEGLDGPWSLTVVDGDVSASFDASVRGLALAGMVSDRGIAGVQLADNRVVADVTLWDEDRTYLELATDLDLDRLDVSVSTLVFSPTWTHTWHNDGPIHLRLDGDRVEELSLSMTSERGGLRAVGSLGISGPWDARVVVDELQLDLLAEYFPMALGGTSGTVQVTADLGGDATNPQVQANVALGQVWYGDLIQWLDVSGPVNLTDGVLDTQLKVGVADRPIADVRAELPVHADLTASPRLDGNGDISVNATVLHGSLQRFGWLLPTAELPDGDVAAHLTVRGPLADPGVVLSAVTEARSPGWDLPVRLEVEAMRLGPELSLDMQVYEGLLRRASVTGTGVNRWDEALAFATGGPAPDWNDWTLWASELEAWFRPTNWPLESLLAPAFAVADLDVDLDISGGLSGEARLTGSPLRPVIRSDLYVENGTIGQVPMERLALGLTRSPRGYQAALTAAFGEQGDLSIVGLVPADLDLAQGTWETWFPEGLALDVVGSVPIAMAPALGAPVSGARGSVVLSGTLTGSAVAPIPDISARIENAGMRVEPLAVLVSDTSATARINTSGVTVSTYEVHTAPAGALLGNLTDTTERLFLRREQSRNSTIRGSARAEVLWGETSPSLAGLLEQDVTVEAVATLDGAWLSALPHQQLQLTGSVRLDGDWPALNASGEVRVDHGFARINAANLFVSNPLEPDRVLTIHRAGLAAVREEEAPPFWAPFTADIAVDLGRNVNGAASLPLLEDLGRLGATFSRVDGSARVGGSLVVGLDRGVPTARGKLSILSGKASALQSNFDLNEGSVQFIGGPITNPTLDLSASMQASEATVNMRVSGTANQPRIVFSCEEFPEQSQIFTLLLTGQPPDQVGADEGQAAQAVAGLLASSVLGGASLGAIDIQPDGSLRIGIPIDRRLYGSVYLAPLETDVDENKVEVEMEWVILDNVVLGGRYGDVNSGAELLWELRF